MKNRKFFSAALYKEGLRQTGVIGLAYLAISVFVSLISFITTLAENNASSVSFSAENNLLGYTLGFIVAAPVLCLTLFHFLNTRAASDIYHSILQSRLQLFASFFAAIQTWLTLPVLVGVLNVVFKDIFIKNTSADYGEIVLYAFILFACNFLVSSAVVLTMTLCSTVFSQLAVSAIILFLPHALLTQFYKAVAEIEALVPQPQKAGGLFGNIFSAKYNCLFGIFSFVYGADNKNYAVAVIYTFLLASVLAAAGAVLFVRRKSEIAATSAPNDVLQAVIRILAAFAFCLPCCMSFIKGTAEFSTVALLLFLAIAAYFTYELITKGTLRGSRKSMLIGLAVLVGINTAFVLGVFGAAAIIRSVDTSADNIAYVSVCTQTESSSETGNYARRLASGYKITDKETIALVSNWIEDTKHLSKVNIGDNEEILDIRLKNGITIRRQLSNSIKKSKTDFAVQLCEDENFADSVFTLPPKDEILSCSLEDTPKLFNDDESLELFESFRDEFEQLSKEEQYFLMRDSLDYASTAEIGNIDDDSVSYLDTFVVTVQDKMKTAYFYIELTSLTPKTCDLYLKLCINDTSLDEIFERAYLFASYYYSSFFTLTLSDGSTPLSHAAELHLTEDDESKNLLDRLVGDRMTTYDPNKPIVKFYYITYDYLSEYTNISDSTVDAIFFEVKDMELFYELCEESRQQEYATYQDLQYYKIGVIMD